MPDQDVFTLPTETTEAEAEAAAPKPKPARKQAVDPLWSKPPGDQTDEPEAPEPEAPKGPEPPLPDARLIQGQWLVKRRGRTYACRPSVRPDGTPETRSIYQPIENGAILDDVSPVCDEPGRLEAAFQSADCRMAPVSLHDDEPIDAEINRLIEMGLNAVADMLREKHPRPPRVAYGGLALGVVQASTSIHRLGPGPARDDLRPFLKRHAQGDYGDRGKLAEVELNDDAREFPGAFGGAVMNAVSIERGFGLVWSTYSGAEIVADPRWRDDRCLHIATILDESPRTYVWTNFDGISTN